ncbi:hypothetical protein pb186bvf_016960 [Paramecium bursaria]
MTDAEVQQSINDNNIDQIEKKSDNHTFQMCFFFMQGVSSLSGWNAILTGLNYFNSKFQGQNCAFSIPIPNFVGSTLIGLLLPYISNYLSLQFRIAYALVLQSAFIILLPIVAEFYPDDFGFYLALFVTFFIGSFGCLQQNSSTGLAALLGFDYVNMFFVGTGFSGMIICCFRFFSLAVIDQSQPAKSIMLYFGVSTFLNVITISMYFVFKATPQFQRVKLAQRKQKTSMIVYDANVSNQDPTKDSSLIQESVVTLQASPMDKNTLDQMGLINVLFWINKIAFPIPIMIMLLYIQTFLMYPGITLKKQFDDNFADWGITILIFSYNVGDTVGKSFAGTGLYNQTCLIITFLLRFLFLFPYIMIAKNVLEQNWLSYLNTFMFAVLNGFITTGFMQLGPNKSDEGFIKEKIGFVNGFTLLLGIMIGTFLAIPFNGI